jgi:uncharacterized protein (TIGR02594 family)
MTLPDQYKFLEKEPGPKILKEAISCYGIKEIPGPAHEKVILAWADEIGGWIGDFYNSDEIAWCGLFIAVCAKRAGFPFNQKALAAREWVSWGKRALYPSLGDVLIFQRTGGGHVGLYVGEDDSCFHVLGGNQGNTVSIVRIDKNRLLASRRCDWKVAQPDNVRKIVLGPHGPISEDWA